jgi:SAM-dependent methyltransferase
MRGKSPLAYEFARDPELLPPVQLMLREGINILEEWFRWAEEWVMVLKFYGGLKMTSRVLEVGCGLGRIAFPLRYQLLAGAYEGFDICAFKIEFLRKHFARKYPTFHFQHADIHNTEYNPTGKLRAENFCFPYPDSAFDIAYAASVFTHLAPESARNYLREIARVLRPEGRALISVFLLDYFDRKRSRPLGCARKFFDFHYFPDSKFPDSFAVADRKNWEATTAYKLEVLTAFASEAGLETREIAPGMWSGGTDRWILPQDLIVLRRRTT